MNRFIFVCYEHGTGGEGLCASISGLPFCEDLKFERMGSRTWTYDYFDKFFLTDLVEGWEHSVTADYKGEKYQVIPSHADPFEIQKKFPDAYYIVINSPVTVEDKIELKNTIFEKVWKTRHNTFAQRIGYFMQFSEIYNKGKKPTRDQLKKLKDDKILNGEIRCLVHGLEPNDDNMKILWSKHVRTKTTLFKHKESATIFPIPYGTNGNTKPVHEWLRSKIDSK